MNYIPLPLDKIDFDRPLPINVWDPVGNLLLRKGSAIQADRPRHFFESHQACVTEADFRAWQRAYDRKIYALLRQGASLDLIGSVMMPDALQESDYAAGFEVQGGWLDLREVLHGILSLGEEARRPMDRIEGIQDKVRSLLKTDADEGLFILFQGLADTTLGYCATHALLCAVVCELTAQKLNLPEVIRALLVRAALLMNIGMAKEQDVLARQKAKPDELQQALIGSHPQKSVAILRGFGLTDEDVLDIVAWHHEPDESLGLSRNLECRRILRVADRFVARMAPRSTRTALSGMGAAKSMVTHASGEEARVGSAMATAVGFYPPGTYVKLANSEVAVSVRRGFRANTPMVVSIVDNLGVAMSSYIAKDTRDPQFTIRAPVNFERVRQQINAARILKAVPKPDHWT